VTAAPPFTGQLTRLTPGRERLYGRPQVVPITVSKGSITALNPPKAQTNVP